GHIDADPLYPGVLCPEHGPRSEQPAVGQQLDALWLSYIVPGGSGAVAGFRRNDRPGLGGPGGGAASLGTAVPWDQGARRGLSDLPRDPALARQPRSRSRGDGGTGQPARPRPPGVPGGGGQSEGHSHFHRLPSPVRRPNPGYLRPVRGIRQPVPGAGMDRHQRLRLYGRTHASLVRRTSGQAPVQSRLRGVVVGSGVGAADGAAGL
ncbi:Transporter, LysE family, partial [Pseudomonas sp. FEN]